MIKIMLEAKHFLKFKKLKFKTLDKLQEEQYKNNKIN